MTAGAPAEEHGADRHAAGFGGGPAGDGRVAVVNDYRTLAALARRQAAQDAPDLPGLELAGGVGVKVR